MVVDSGSMTLDFILFIFCTLTVSVIFLQIIRILEKLAPNQSVLFGDIDMENKNADAAVSQVTSKTDSTTNSLLINNAKEDDSYSASTSAFAFLSLNSSMQS